MATITIGAWNKWYAKTTKPLRMGNVITYREAIAFLDQPGFTIEDWGGGTGFARQLVRNGAYKVIDGSQNSIVEGLIVDDLTTRRCSVDCIMIRHVLEHNENWQAILRNALTSFTKRMVLITFTPFAPGTETILSHKGKVPAWNERQLPLLVIEELIKASGSAWDVRQFGKPQPRLTEHVFRIAKDNSLHSNAS